MTELLNERLPDKSESRRKKIEQAIHYRQPSLTIVIENIHDPHNINAILRSCDGAGVIDVHMVYTIEKRPNLASTTSRGARKWLDIHHHEDIPQCYKALRSKGFQILATKLDSSAHQLYDRDLAQPTALVFGNEHRGISETAAELADGLIYIPMMGMTESLNVSVAAAVTLYEALRQRREQGMYKEPQLSENGLRSKLADWLRR